MAESPRDQYVDSSRDGSGQQRASQVSTEAPHGVPTTWQEKKKFGKNTVGTRGAADVAPANNAASDD